MGNEYSYQEAGKWHPDTIAYDDETELKKIGKVPKKITQIRVWSSEYIVGMEVFYDGISAGARMGSEYFKGVVYQDLVLGPKEHIKVVKGRCGDLIDQVAFKTTKGREISFGTSTGGKKFKLKDAAGRIVKGFKVGFGGHLHSLGVFFGHIDHTQNFGKKKHKHTPVPAPIPTPMPVPTPGTSFPTPMPVPTPAPAPVPTYPSHGTSIPVPQPVSTPSYPTSSIPAPQPVSTPTYPTHTTTTIPTPQPVSTPTYPTHTTTSIPAPQPVSTHSYPTTTTIPTPQPVSTPSYPTAASTIPTPQPVSTPSYPSYPTTTSTIPTPTPVSTHSSLPSGATYTPPAFPVPTPTPTYVPVPTPAPVIPTLTKSNVCGKVHADTAQFDDYTSNKDTFTSYSDVRLSELRVIHNNKLVFGFEAIYEANGQSVSGGMHVGNEMDHKTVNQSVVLAYGETITAISGKHGNVIDSISITTSTGKIYKFGGTGGDFSYSVYIPAGKTVKAVAGGTGGHLHNLSVYYS